MMRHLLVLGAAVAGPAAAAQQPDTVTVAPLVVTATRLPMPSDVVSAAVTVIPGEVLAARGIHTVADALRDVLGAAVVRAGSWGSQTSLFLRGGESDYVKVLIDGVSVNAPGGAFDFAHLTTVGVDRIEIVRGPTSVLYGSDAVTGVVHVFTRRGAGPARGTLAAHAGSHGASRIGAALAGGGGVWSWSAAGERSVTDGLYAFNNGYANATAGGSVRVTPDARTDGVFTARWSDVTSHFPTDGAGRPVDSNQVVTERGPTLGLEVGRRLGTLEGRVQLAWHEADLRFDDAPDGPADTVGVYAYQSRSETRRAGVGVRVHWRPAGGEVVTAGVEYEHQRLLQSSEAQTAFGPFADALDTARATTAYFAQALAPVGRRLWLSIGARLEDNERFGAYATWRAGAVVRIGPATRLRLNAGSGFKEPTFLEQYGGAGTIGNPGLAPERSHSWEAGVEHGFGSVVALTLSFFAQRFSDLIAYTFAPAPPDSSNYFNVAGARADGVEATVRWRPGAGVLAELGYTYLDTRVTDPGFDEGVATPFAGGQRLLRRPAHAGHARVWWQGSGRWQASVDTRLVGARDDLDFSMFPFARVRLAPYAVAGIAGAVDLAGSGPVGIVLRARLNNVLGARYAEAYGFRSPGRTVTVGAEMRLPS